MDAPQLGLQLPFGFTIWEGFAVLLAGMAIRYGWVGWHADNTYERAGALLFGGFFGLNSLHYALLKAKIDDRLLLGIIVAELVVALFGSLCYLVVFGTRLKRIGQRIRSPSEV